MYTLLIERSTFYTHTSFHISSQKHNVNVLEKKRTFHIYFGYNHEGVLVSRVIDLDQIVVHDSIQAIILKLARPSTTLGHLGERKIYISIRPQLY